MRDLFLNRPYDHIGASRTSFDRGSHGYAGSYYRRPTSAWDKALRTVAVLIALAALGLLMGAR